ncbi:MAG: acyl-ACP--UDP-N-acetylglucosamine O-acyltransferase [Verrucomicrobiales bacterium]|nr:acyl-ACP--UDP-N-acetylglucosamine O-acyltransferase [Verrucomicrobiales bacterium]
MNVHIHPSAVIDPAAHLDPSVEVGPGAVIDAGVTLGPGCVVGPHVHLTGRTTIGPGNRFHAGSVIGDAPQDTKYRDTPTGLVIGEGNVFREHVTVHRSNTPEERTEIGSHCFLMANSHVGHNSRLGDHVILANGVLLGGHVEVGNAAFLSGNSVVHQFVRVGALAMLQGASAVSQDLPPFVMARGRNSSSGLNTVGLRRAGITAAVRLELRQLYHVLFLGTAPMQERLAAARAVAQSAEGRLLVDFVASSRRGCIRARNRSLEDLE